MKRIFNLIIFVMAIITAGCASKSPLMIWQDNLTHYISTEGKGDPLVLRDTVDMHALRIQRPARITFGGLLSDPGNPLFSDDVAAKGVLLGIEEIESHHWFLFLVGTSKEPDSIIEDVRLVGFTNEQTELRWRVAERDEEAVRKYLSALPEEIKGTEFPPPWDIYDLAISGSMVEVREDRSGAVWQMNLQD
jgi:hypothetical protein